MGYLSKRLALVLVLVMASSSAGFIFFMPKALGQSNQDTSSGYFASIIYNSGQNQYNFSVSSDSYIKGLTFDPAFNTLYFTVPYDGLTGNSQVCFPKSLYPNFPSRLMVTLDCVNRINYNYYSLNDDYWILNLIYKKTSYPNGFIVIDFEHTSTPTPTVTASPTANPTTQPTSNPTTYPTTSPTQTTSSTPSVPEFSWLTILPILLSIPIVLVVVWKRLELSHKGNV